MIGVEELRKAMCGSGEAKVFYEILGQNLVLN